MTYRFNFFVGKFPKFFNFSSSMEKNYRVELNIFKENAIYGLQEILLDNSPGNFYIWSAIVMVRECKKSRYVIRQNFELEINILRRSYFRFACFCTRFNFRCANFDSFSWCICLSYGVCRLHVQLKTLSSLLNAQGFPV